MPYKKHSFICRICGKKFEANSMNRKFCSYKCAYGNRSIDIKHKNERLKFVCKLCKKIFFDRTSKSYRKFCSKECSSKSQIGRVGPKQAKKFKKQQSERMKKDNPMRHKKFREKISKIRRRLYKEGKLIPYWLSKKRPELSIRNRNPEFIKKRLFGLIKKPNKPEEFIINLIQKNNLNFDYVGNGRVIFGSFNPDFINKDKKLIIEHFGDYWHNLPKYKDLDKRRLKAYLRYGYKTLVIWEHELKNPNQIIDKIKEFQNY